MSDLAIVGGGITGSGLGEGNTPPQIMGSGGVTSRNLFDN